MPLSLTQFTHHSLLLLLLDLEVLVERLYVWHQALIWIRDVLGLALDSLLECFKDIGLNIIGMEL